MLKKRIPLAAQRLPQLTYTQLTSSVSAVEPGRNLAEQFRFPRKAEPGVICTARSAAKVGYERQFFRMARFDHWSIGNAT
jgi:hypothetical protein